MSRDVPAGASTPNHDGTSNPGKPDSAIVGTCGTAGDRVLFATASTRSLPAFADGMTAASPPNETATWPPSRSLIAAPLPLYGTCTMSIFAMMLNSAPARCDGAPMPADAYVT